MSVCQGFFADPKNIGPFLLYIKLCGGYCSIKTIYKPLQHLVLLQCDFKGIKRVTQTEIAGIRLN